MAESEVAPHQCYICGWGTHDAGKPPICPGCQKLLDKEAFGPRAGYEQTPPPPSRDTDWLVI